MILLIILSIVFIALISLRVLKTKSGIEGFSKNFPGPTLRLPLIGHAYLLGDQPLRAVDSLKKKYGPVFRLDIGNLPTVFLCDWDSIYEVNKSGNIDERPQVISPPATYAWDKDSRGFILGIGTSNGRNWLDQRKFSTRALANLGFGNNDALDSIITKEMEKILTKLKSFAESGKSLNPKKIFSVASGQVIYKIMTGKALPDEDMETIIGNLDKLFDAMYLGNPLGLLQYNSLWALKIIHSLGFEKSVLAQMDSIDGIVDKILAANTETNGFFIDQYRNKIDEASSAAVSDESNDSFRGQDGHLQLKGVLRDLIIGGTTTTNSSMEWCLLYMCAYPEIQEEMHREIRSLVGLDGRISLEDGNRLNLILAFIEEVMRHSPFSGFQVPRCTLTGFEFKGLRVPKNTQIVFYPRGFFRDPKFFENPDVFNPRRFMDEKGQFHRDKNLFFGLGKRKCLGEKVARSEMLLFLSMLVQRYKVSLDQDKVDLEPHVGFVLEAKPFIMKITERV